MKLYRLDIYAFILLFFVTIITVFDLFINKGRPATFDGLVHITTIAQFSTALSQGEFPVRWMDGFANYGMPYPLLAHQLPTYLGAFINLLVHNPVVSFNIVCFIGLLLSNAFYYLFLRLYFTPLISFVATFLFNFAPYRIINLYIRGALPEAFSNVFLPLILIGIYLLVKKKNINGFYLLVLSFCLLTLTHPMTVIIYSFLFIPYFLFLLNQRGIFLKRERPLFRKNSLLVLSFFSAFVIGLGMASYYIIPLNIEIKYFFYGMHSNHLTEGQYLGLINYFDPKWYYFTKNEIFPRGHVIKSGVLEIAGVILGAVIIVINYLVSKKRVLDLFTFSVLTSILVIFFTLSFSGPFYRHINLLSNIQLPWRMMSTFIFLPPIIFAYYLSRINNKIIILLFIVVVCIFRFPQLYGKNYAEYPQSMYYFTPINLPAVVLNTIWTGKTESYPIKKFKAAIIEGKGNIVYSNIKNSSRDYVVKGITPIRMVDYTFYFPGWDVFVDGEKTTIEYQDPNYRGVITYRIQSGIHKISLHYGNTVVRKISYILSGIFLLFFIILFFLKNKIKRYIYE